MADYPYAHAQQDEPAPAAACYACAHNWAHRIFPEHEVITEASIRTVLG